jgi:glycosyltransferase involved in cell wall biosynthesis
VTRSEDGPKRLLVLLTDGFGGRGGIAKFNRDLLAALCEMSDIDRVVALPRLAPEPVGNLPRKLEYRLDGIDGIGRYSRSLLRLALAERFDLIVCAHINLLPFAAIAAQLSRAPTLLTVHGIDAWSPTPRPLTNLLAGRVDACFAVSEFTRQRFLGWSGLPPARAALLPNCVDLEAYSPGPKPDALLQRYGFTGRQVLLTLARLSASERYKGIDEILDCLPALLQESPDLVYIIVGDGDDRGRLSQKARALGLGERVIFAGHVPESEKAEHYRLADAFVMPSRGEGFGIVFLEAMACGIPVLASPLDASREAVQGSDIAVLADPRNPQELRTGVLRALQMPRGRAPSSLANFSRERFKARVQELVGRLM